MERARQLKVPYIVFDRATFYQSEEISDILKEHSIDLIVLAGFLWLIPDSIIHAYSGRIVNIHPALLPAYGGKGMYGDAVHQAVIANGETRSGITIHYVNEQYDKGNTSFRFNALFLRLEDAHSLAQKVHELEYIHFPAVIEQILENL